MILAIDGNHNLHRCLHTPAYSELKLGDMVTGGIYGALRVIRNLLESFKTERCIVVWDGGKSEYRTELYPGYKAHRQPKTDEEKEEKKEYFATFNDQKLVLNSLFKILGVRSVEVRGYEGDDLLYIISQVHNSQDVIIVSEDLDLAQLVGPHVKFFRPLQEQLIDEGNFELEMNCSLANFVTYKAIVGDKSDNVYGIKGVGAKTASSVLAAYGEVRDLDRFRDYCMMAKSKRISDIGVGMHIVATNRLLMDLACLPHSEDNTQAVVNALFTSSVKTDPESVRVRLSKLKFDSILENFSSWVQPFRKLL